MKDELESSKQGQPGNRGEKTGPGDAGTKPQSGASGPSKSGTSGTSGSGTGSSLTGLWNSFSSIRLAIILLIILAAASLLGVLIGEFIPQGASREYYVARYGLSKYRLFKGFGLISTYKSFWYVAILILLNLNIIVCTLKRLRPTWKAAFSFSFRNSEREMGALRIKGETEVAASLEDTCNALSTGLRNKGYKVGFKNEPDKILVSASKGGLGRMGFLVTHVAMLLILVGGIIGSLGGFRVTKYGGAGDLIAVPDREFKVRVDSVWIELNDRQELKDYHSKLTVLEGGNPVLTKVIRVNDPLQYHGVSFYQSEFPQDPRRIERAQIMYSLPGHKPEKGEVVAEFQKITEIEGTPVSLRIDDFVADFVIDDKGDVVSRSDEAGNPAAKISVYENGEYLFSKWLFANFPDFHGGGGEKYSFEFGGYMPAHRTGLQVAYNPGRMLIWAGIFLGTFGIFISFYIYHKKVWGYLAKSAGDDRTKVIVGGVSNKSTTGLSNDINSIIGSLGNLRN